MKSTATKNSVMLLQPRCMYDGYADKMKPLTPKRDERHAH